MSDNLYTIKSCVDTQRKLKSEIRNMKANMKHTRGDARKGFQRSIHDSRAQYYALGDKINAIRESRKKK